MDTAYQADKAWLLNIQRKLYSWSRSHPGERWRDMWNWVTDPQNLRLAWRRAASNRGARTAGVDKVTVRSIKATAGVDAFLAELRTRLRDGDYAPSPVRRVLIPKRGKPGAFRPLGVPTVEDRVVQAALLHLLEPIFEADFYQVSYGFRPKRACRDALEHIRCTIRPGKRSQDRLDSPYQWVVEGDIKGCFDNIDHRSVMVRLRRRIADAKVGRLVRTFLKSGILANDAFLRTDAGTPQGGVLSPLLANIVLSAIEERYQRFVIPGRRRDGRPYADPPGALSRFRCEERAAGRPVFYPIRYADDFVVLVSASESVVRAEKDALGRFLDDELRLTLSPEKTHVTRLTEGFLFLGHRVRLRWDDRWGLWPRIEIPKERTKDLCHRIKQVTKEGTHQSLQALIDAINPILRGWAYFYRHCYGAKNIFSRIDNYVWWRIWHWLRKKYPKTPSRVIFRRYMQRNPEGTRSQWAEQRPLVTIASIRVERHNLARRRFPDYHV